MGVLLLLLVALALGATNQFAANPTADADGGGDVLDPVTHGPWSNINVWSLENRTPVDWLPEDEGYINMAKPKKVSAAKPPKIAEAAKKSQQMASTIKTTAVPTARSLRAPNKIHVLPTVYVAHSSTGTDPNLVGATRVKRNVEMSTRVGRRLLSRGGDSLRKDDKRNFWYRRHANFSANLKGLESIFSKSKTVSWVSRIKRAYRSVQPNPEKESDAFLDDYKGNTVGNYDSNGNDKKDLSITSKEGNREESKSPILELHDNNSQYDASRTTYNQNIDSNNKGNDIRDDLESGINYGYDHKEEHNDGNANNKSNAAENDKQENKDKYRDNHNDTTGFGMGIHDSDLNDHGYRSNSNSNFPSSQNVHSRDQRYTNNEGDEKKYVHTRINNSDNHMNFQNDGKHKTEFTENRSDGKSYEYVRQSHTNVYQNNHRNYQYDNDPKYHHIGSTNDGNERDHVQNYHSNDHDRHYNQEEDQNNDSHSNDYNSSRGDRDNQHFDDRHDQNSNNYNHQHNNDRYDGHEHDDVQNDNNNNNNNHNTDRHDHNGHNHHDTDNRNDHKGNENNQHHHDHDNSDNGNEHDQGHHGYNHHNSNSEGDRHHHDDYHDIIGDLHDGEGSGESEGPHNSPGGWTQEQDRGSGPAYIWPATPPPHGGIIWDGVLGEELL